MSPKEVLPEDVPFSIERDLIVDIPINPRGIIDVYINNFLGLTINLEDTGNATCLERAPLLGLTAVSREVAKIKPLPWDKMDAQKVSSGDWTYRNKNYAWLGTQLSKDDNSPAGQQTHGLHKSYQ